VVSKLGQIPRRLSCRIYRSRALGARWSLLDLRPAMLLSSVAMLSSPLRIAPLRHEGDTFPSTIRRSRADQSTLISPPGSKESLFCMRQDFTQWTVSADIFQFWRLSLQTKVQKALADIHSAVINFARAHLTEFATSFTHTPRIFRKRMCDHSLRLQIPRSIQSQQSMRW